MAHHDEAAAAGLLTLLERIKWLLWHGKKYRASQEVGFSRTMSVALPWAIRTLVSLCGLINSFCAVADLA